MKRTTKPKPKTKPKYVALPKTPAQFEAMLRIGVSKETVQEARGVILEILRVQECGDTAKVAALQALKDLCAVDGVTISHCNFEAKV